MNIATQDNDYAVPTAADTVRIERLLPGPIERVWAYLTDSGLRGKWLASGEMQAQVGTPFELTWHNDELTDPPGARPEGFDSVHSMQSMLTTFDPPHRLAFTWNGSASGDVSIELQPKGDRVLLTLIHRNLRKREGMLMVGAGWHMHLDILAARMGGAEPAPFWDGWSRLRREYDQRIPAA
jgi:uncharacterized protein YndB with AHSA1/START domain